MSIRITGMNSGLDTDSMVKELVHAYEKQGQKYTKAKTKTEWKQEAWNSLNTKVKNFYSKYADSMRYSDVYSKRITSVSDSSKANVIASGTAVKGSQTLEVNALATSGYLTGGKLSKDVNGEKITSNTKLSDILENDIAEDTKIKINIGSGDAGKFDISITNDTTVGEFVNKLNSLTVSDNPIIASFDENNGRFFISSKDSGAENNFEFEIDSEKSNDILSALKIVGSDAVKLQGMDAKITLNGAEFTSSTNSFSINGMTIQAKATTAPGEKLSLVTDIDVDGIYNSIKGMLKEYNSLINELDKLYNAKNVSTGKNKFEPLSDEEKEAMTDDEIEKWETKIKDSLLSRDSDVEKLASAMRNSMIRAYHVNVNGEDKVFSLASFGIETMGYFEAPLNEKNALHIAGDADDSYSSSKTDKLKEMIANNSETTMEFFTQLFGGLYDEMKKIQSASDNYTTYGSFYGDKKLQSEYDTQDKQVKKWEKYVADIEAKYYKQFTAMEKAMGELQSQQTNLSQLFGAQ